MHEIVLSRAPLLHAVEQIITSAPLTEPVMVGTQHDKQFAFATALSGLELELLHCVPLGTTDAVVTVRVADGSVSFLTRLQRQRPLNCGWWESRRTLIEISDVDGRSV